MPRPQDDSGAVHVRQRAGVIVFVDGRLAVIQRDRPEIGRYHVIPGGGVEPGETAASAAAREAYEETGLAVRVDEAACLRLDGADRVGWYFRAEVVGGRFGTGAGAEFAAAGADRGAYRPVLLTLAEALQVSTLVPAAATEVLLRNWATTGCEGQWWHGQIAVDDPHRRAAVRVRAGAVVIEQGRILLIERNLRGDRWYEIPGGGTEGDETPDEAVLRELAEETGLAGTVVRKLAFVYNEGRHEHYFLVHASGQLGPRAGLDLEDDARPVWLPAADLPRTAVWPRRLAWRIAHWQITGWPAVPAVLSDSVTDLNAPCHW